MKLPFHKESPNDRESETLKIMHSDQHSIHLLSERLRACLKQVPSHQPVVIVCVGTDRSTGDSLGPLVGTQLRRSQLDGLHLYGTLENPVHAMNLGDTLKMIHEHFNNPFIIGIDACLGQLTSVGCIQIGQGPLKPGAGVNKELPPVGNIHITGIVNVSGFMEYFVLQNTRLSLVMSMAEVIAKSFCSAFSGKQHWTTTSLAKIE